MSLGTPRSRIELHPFRRVALALLLALAFVLSSLTVRALETSAVVQDGGQAPSGTLTEPFQQVELAIHNQVAAARHTFHFHNGHSERVEINCTLHTEFGEMVDGFSYWNGAEKIVGEVLEKQKAREIYQKITGLRRDPGILEKRGSTFAFQVYPVEPNELKSVEVLTVRALETREGVVEYRIPRENMPDEGGMFSLTVDLSDDLPIDDVELVGFTALIKDRGVHSKRVVFETDDLLADQDLVLRYRLRADDYALRLSTHRDPGSDGTFMLIVSPKGEVKDADVIGRDVVFVVDRSGSMSGEPLEQAKSALVYVLGELREDDRFDVIAFDDENRSYFGGLREASTANLDDAVRQTEAMTSGGGTNILDALDRALSELNDVDPDRPRAVIFLTDGQGSRPPEVVLARVSEKANGARIYSFGAGTGVNRPFLTRLADDNRGVATFISNTDEIEDAITKLYDRISTPLMVDLELEFDGIDVNSQYPKKLRDLYEDGEVVVFGRFSGAGPATVKLTGTVRGMRRTLALPVVFPKREERGATIEKLWAKRRIDHLMTQIRTRGGDELIAEVTRLGIVYNIVTDYTTFLAIPESEKSKEIREELKKARMGQTRKLIDSMKDVRLSLTHIPPGDPVLSVDAPADALKVIAYFPFGLVEELRYDPMRDRWAVRFLVPRHVADGVYTIRIQIIHADGRIEWRQVPYVIDSTEPEFAVAMPTRAAAGGLIPITVDPYEPVAVVFAYLPGVEKKRLRLRLDPETGFYEGWLPIPEDLEAEEVTVRIVVRDLARNRCQRDLVVSTADPEIDGIDLDPGYDEVNAKDPTAGD